MGLLIMVVGLVLFLGAHVFTTQRPARARVVAGVGEGTYKIICTLVALVGLALLWAFSGSGKSSSGSGSGGGTSTTTGGAPFGGGSPSTSTARPTPDMPPTRQHRRDWTHSRTRRNLNEVAGPSELLSASDEVKPRRAA